ncbi:MAG TPA: TolC family protein, partial [Chloroflexota bacterium]
SQSKFEAGGLSEGDLLKIKLQLLQFQMDVSVAKLARVQALASLRQLIGYELVAESYTVDGALVYQPVGLAKPDLQALAISLRPDLSAARLGVTAAQSQLSLAQANGKRDVTAQFSVSHVAASTTGAFFANIEIPLFDRNQGEIARTRFAITQSQELRSEQTSIVFTDVANAYEGLRTSDEVVRLYQSGYLKQAEDSRDISQYAYQRGGTTLLDFLDAERSYRATALAYLQSLASYMVALETLRQAVGTRSLP